MYRYPDDFTADPIVGRTLEMICFTANQVSFHFDASIAITAEVPFLAALIAGGTEEVVEVPQTASSLPSLIEDVVKYAEIVDQVGLRLTFETGRSLGFTLAEARYESYLIRLGDHEIII